MSLTNRRFVSPRRAGWLAILTMLAGPGLALAQHVPGPSSAPSSSGLIVETMESGFVLVPDFRFTEVDDDFGGLAGVRAGWLTDDRLLIGGGGYWLTNGSEARKMAYGGLVVDWSLARSQRFGLSFGALVGGGSSTLAAEVAGRWPGRLHGDRFRGSGGSVEPTTFLVPVSEGFFIAEPQASVSLMLSNWLRVGAGVSYRWIGGAGEFESRLRGVAGTVSVQLGVF